MPPGNPLLIHRDNYGITMQENGGGGIGGKKTPNHTYTSFYTKSSKEFLKYIMQKKKKNSRVPKIRWLGYFV